MMATFEPPPDVPDAPRTLRSRAHRPSSIGHVGVVYEAPPTRGRDRVGAAIALVIGALVLVGGGVLFPPYAQALLVVGMVIMGTAAAFGLNARYAERAEELSIALGEHGIRISTRASDRETYWVDMSAIEAVHGLGRDGEPLAARVRLRNGTDVELSARVERVSDVSDRIRSEIAALEPVENT